MFEFLSSVLSFAKPRTTCALAVTAGLVLVATAAAQAQDHLTTFIEAQCLDCHDAGSSKADLDLSSISFASHYPQTVELWTKIFDRVSAGEMPPKTRERPTAGELGAFLESLAKHIRTTEEFITARQGRSTQRRLNRYEYENAVRDLLDAPWLQLKERFPEDGEAFLFNKVGEVLDFSYVQMARYVSSADYALRQVLTVGPFPPRVTRYYAREQRRFTAPMAFNVFNVTEERCTFPVFGFAGQPDVRSGKAPISVGVSEPAKRELEGMGVVASSYEPIELRFDSFTAPVSGYYRLRLNAHSIWVGPKKAANWWIPDLDDISRGRRPEPVTIYSETKPRILRRLATIDVNPDPAVYEIEAWLLAGETIRPDAARLFRPMGGPSGRTRNPLAQEDGCPGVAFRWLEVEGPLPRSPSPFATLDSADDVNAEKAVSEARRLLRAFLARAYRRSLQPEEAEPFVDVVQAALRERNGFRDALIAGYTAVLCSPGFLLVQERPGRLDGQALATRLSLFLWNSTPDDELRALALHDGICQPDVLRLQTERMLRDPRSHRFLDAFLRYWLDLRKSDALTPDATLYPDYYLDDMLSESSLEETHLFFAEILAGNLPARNVVDSDFAILNERLAAHYGLPGVAGSRLRRVELPPGSTRGGLLTQAAVLKISANGTTTSPVLRGAWVMKHILGQPPPPPPPDVPGLEPDIRGASTIRLQLERHSSAKACASCHAKFDPAGFALESFDVMGGYRERYRVFSGGTPAGGLGHTGQKFRFHEGAVVDCSGHLPDGRSFANIREFKKLLVSDEESIARNLVRQLMVYATGAPIRFSDRPAIDEILRNTKPSSHGVRDIVCEVVQSPLFQTK